jgi:hypothetical protein
MKASSTTTLTAETLRQTSSLLAQALPQHDGERPQDLQLLPRRFCTPQDADAWPKLQGRGFFYGSVDFLPVRTPEGLAWQLLEFNGTGVGGLLRLPGPVLDAVLGELSALPSRLPSREPLIVCTVASKARRTIIERIMIAQAIKAGLEARHGRAEIVVVPRGDIDLKLPDGPLVVLLGQALAGLRARDGRVWLLGRQIDAIVRDLHCQHVRDCFPNQLDADSFVGVNDLYDICASKAKTYAAYNRFVDTHASRCALRRVDVEITDDQAGLRDSVARVLARGRGVVIKPHAGGGGRGIAFLHPSDSAERVSAEIESALGDQPGASSRGFPYVTCEMIDCATIEHTGHPLFGHRFELRILVFRIRDSLRAFPTLCRVAGSPYDPSWEDRRMLINTMMRSIASRPAAECALPLCNSDTLATIGMTIEQLVALCDAATAFVHGEIEARSSAQRVPALA